MSWGRTPRPRPGGGGGIKPLGSLHVKERGCMSSSAPRPLRNYAPGQVCCVCLSMKCVMLTAWNCHSCDIVMSFAIVSDAATVFCALQLQCVL